MPAKPYVYDGNGNWIGIGVPDILPPSTGTNPRDSLIYGDYKPDASNTGPPSTVTLTQFGSSSTNYDFVVGTDVAPTQPSSLKGNGQIIENLEIWGRVSIGTYTNVVIKNCIIHGTLSRGINTAHVVASSDDLRGALIIDCKLMGRPVTIPATFNGDAQPDAGTVNTANEWCGGIRGCNYTIRRTEVTSTADGLAFTKLPGNVTIEGCWIHNGWYNEWPASRGSASNATAATAKFYPYSTGTANYTHVDGIQFHIGKNYTIVGNRIGGTRTGGDHNVIPSEKDQINSGDDMYNAALMIKQEVNNSAANKIENVLIDRNWFGGGSCTVNIPYGNDNMFESITISNNKFQRATTGIPQYYVLRGRNNGVSVANFSNNTFEDNGTPVTINNG